MSETPAPIAQPEMAPAPPQEPAQWDLARTSDAPITVWLLTAVFDVIWLIAHPTWGA